MQHSSNCSKFRAAGFSSAALFCLWLVTTSRKILEQLIKGSFMSLMGSTSSCPRHSAMCSTVPGSHWQSAQPDSRCSNLPCHWLLFKSLSTAPVGISRLQRQLAMSRVCLCRLVFAADDKQQLMQTHQQHCVLRWRLSCTLFHAATILSPGPEVGGRPHSSIDLGGPAGSRQRIGRAITSSQLPPKISKRYRLATSCMQTVHVGSLSRG